MNMREKIARAIAADIEKPMPRFVQQTWDQLTDLAREAMFRRADAVLGAMREPTEGMIEAGFRAPDRGMNLGQCAEATFTAMIDAAKDGA